MNKLWKKIYCVFQDCRKPANARKCKAAVCCAAENVKGNMKALVTYCKEHALNDNEKIKKKATKKKAVKKKPAKKKVAKKKVAKKKATVKKKK